MLHASCHCGAVRLEVPRRPRALTQCNCSICRRYGALWAYYSRRTVRILADAGVLAAYRRTPKGTIDFFHCTICGCLTHYERVRKRADGRHTLAVNGRTFDEVEVIASVPIKMLDGDGSWSVLFESKQPHLFQTPANKRESQTKTIRRRI